MNKKIEKIILKYFSNSATINELEELAIWLNNSSNIEFYKQYVKVKFIAEYALVEFDTEEEKKKILERIREKKSKIRKLTSSNFIRYAAAITIIIATGYYLTQDQFSSQPAVVKIKNDIPIGTDKATLTLDDGSNIALEKGKSFKTQNILSDGEKIIYSEDVDQSAKEEIAYNFLTIPRGGEFYIELSDKTKVWLNADSRLKYPVKFIDGQPREVELEYGEAYFDVSSSTQHEGSNFRVITMDQKIEVLGTKFNVRAYKNDTSVETILAEGSVAIEFENSSSILKPNEQLVFDKNSKEIVINQVDADYEISWFLGYYRFKSKPLGEIAKVLERWYEVEFHFDNPDLKNIEFQGVISKYKNIESFLITLKNTENINYKIKDNQIHIK